MYSKILVATDGSDESLRGAEHAAALVKAFKAKATLIHVRYVPTSYITDIGPGLMEVLADEGRRILKETKQVFDEANLSCDTKLITEGRPADVICKIAERDGYDLIIIGVRGSGHVKRRVMGSVSSTVAECAPCPVLLVR